jgi:hypothetical protein
MTSCAIALDLTKAEAYVPAREQLDSLIEQLRAPQTRADDRRPSGKSDRKRRP